jgi:hypothetical protein
MENKLPVNPVNTNKINTNKINTYTNTNKIPQEPNKLEQVPETILLRQKAIQDAISHERRIINFFGNHEDIIIPQEIYLNILNLGEFSTIIILGAGDGWYGQNGDKISDIQGFYEKYSPEYILIFVCHPDFWINRYGNKHIESGDALVPNINYLLENPDLNILLCFMDINNKKHCKKLAQLFAKSISLIDSDEPVLMPYLAPEYCYELLHPYGECINIYERYIQRFKDFRINGYRKFSVHKDKNPYKTEYYKTTIITSNLKNAHVHNNL